MNDLFGQGFTHLVQVYVPGTQGTDRLDIAQQDAIVAQVEKQLSLLFGGATSVPATGSWVSEETEELIRERVVIVFSYASDLVEGDLVRVKAIAQTVARALSQEAVLVVIDGAAYFVRSFRQ